MSLPNYVGYVGLWVAWVASIENLRRSRGLHGSLKFWGGLKKMAWEAWVGVFPWVAWVHEIVLLKRHHQKFRKIYRKTSVLESLVK